MRFVPSTLAASRRFLPKFYVAQHGRITRQEVIELCRLTPDQAYKLLRRLTDEKILEKQGNRKGSYYIESQDIRPGV